MLNRTTYFPKNTEFDIQDEMEFAREELIYNITRDLLVFMENKSISKSDLALVLNKSKAFISQTLNGNRNMTLGTLSDFCFAIGAKLKIDLIEEKPEVKDCFFEDCIYVIEDVSWKNSQVKKSASTPLKKWETADTRYPEAA